MKKYIKNTKKSKTKSTRRLRQNSSLREANKYFVQEFIPLLANNIANPTLSGISLLLRYKNEGHICSDCKSSWEFCACEGSRNRQDYPCEDCKQLRCVCDIKPTRKYVMDIAFSNLNNHQLYLLRKQLENIKKWSLFNSTQKGRINRSIYEIDLFLNI